jgi:integrase/recombinase XerD
MNYQISITLDKRRAKASGKYPVRLRVFTSNPRKQKLYPTTFDMSPGEYESTIETIKPREANKTTRKKLDALKVKAEKACDELDTFTFEAFERKFFRKTGAGADVFYQYDEAVKKLRTNKQLGTADTYELSKKSIKAYAKHRAGREVSKLQFVEITKEWLNGYEDHMVSGKGRSYTTVSIYVRVLRTLFNTAIDEKEVPRELYPFGKRKYTVPNFKAVKKALTHEQLTTLYHAKPMTHEQEKAKDFWFLSYASNGMNIKDIAMLRHINIKDGKITYLRAKTIRTSKGEQSEVQVTISEMAQAIIEKYGNRTSNPKGLVFSIISEGQSALEQQKRIKNFTRAINHNMKLLAASNDLPRDISTYWARHSMATNAIRQGASMEYVSNALNHSDLSTTKGYFAGFDDDTHKTIQEKLTAF